MVEAVAADEPEGRLSGLGGQLNAGCDDGDCGKHVVKWLLWKPPFASV